MESSVMLLVPGEDPSPLTMLLMLMPGLVVPPALPVSREVAVDAGAAVVDTGGGVRPSVRIGRLLFLFGFNDASPG
jgi:hypothetical protein